MEDRISRLQETADRLAREVSELKASLKTLRDEAAGSTASAPARSRIDEFNAAVPPGGEGGTVPPQPPARSWDDVMKSLGATPAAQAPQPPRAPTAAARRGIEELVGRYGTIALASLTILMGIGALLGWAIRNGYIGPTTRVALGLVAALVLAVFGWRIRRGDSPRYGNALLALSLAVVHVVAWGAGPRLQLVNSAWVLALAGLASAALATLAWRENDQTLFNIGFGGALLAPFVTSTGGGSAILLLSYGFVVLLAGIASLAQREWTQSPLVATAGVGMYAAAGASMVDGNMRWAIANAPVVFSLGLGAVAGVLLEGRKKMAVTWPALVVALAALTHAAFGTSLPAARYVLAIALCIAAGFAGETSLRGFRTALLGGLLLPLGSAVIAVAAVGDAISVRGVLTALLFASLSGLAAWRNLMGDRGTHAFAATLMVGLAISLSGENRQWMCLMISAFGVVTALATRRFALPGIGLAGAMWLTGATVVAFTMLGNRPRFEYRPFLTQESVAALAVSAAWFMISWHTARNLKPGSALAQELPRGVIRILGAVVAFFWIRQELAHAWSPDVSGFLLVAYYAIAGVCAIFVGRWRELQMLRQVGLALSLFAAVTAITQATLLGIGWRVGSYLLTGAFLLGVAWSYRVTRAEPASTPSPEGAAP